MFEKLFVNLQNICRRNLLLNSLHDGEETKRSRNINHREWFVLPVILNDRLNLKNHEKL